MSNMGRESMVARKRISALFFAVLVTVACASVPKNGTSEHSGPTITNLKLPTFAKAGVLFPVEFDFINESKNGIKTVHVSMELSGGKYFDDHFSVSGTYYGVARGHIKANYFLRGPGSFFVRVYIVDGNGKKSNVLRGLVVVN